MYRAGHYGVALVAATPIGAVVPLVAPVEVALLAVGGVVALTPVPDYDQRVPFLDHRGSTHTVGFALLVGVATGAVGWAVAGTATPPGSILGAVLGWTVGVTAIVAHLAADAVTPAGIRPFWPASDREIALGWVRAANPLANYALLALGVVVALGGLALGVRVAGA